MKKTLSLFLALALLCTAGLSLKAPVFAEEMGGGAEIPAPIPTYSGIDPYPEASQTPVPAETQAPSYDPVVPTIPVVPATPVQPEATAPANPTGSGIPVITKHPTSETVQDGGYAEFVARADNYQKIEWYYSYGTNGTEYLIWFAPDHFPGLIATGIEGERLGLDHIPYTMDSWRVRAKFIGTEGETYTNYAEIYVKTPELEVPTIAQQPRSVSLRDNEAVNLEVTASSPDANTRLTYQWYMNSTDSNTGGKVIYSATNASYIPDYIVGTTYYYCVVRSTDGITTSQPVKTACAAVTYSAAVPETTAPPATQPATVAPTVSETSAPLTPIWAETTEDASPEPPAATVTRAGNPLILILVISILVIILLSLLAIFLILKFYPRDEDEEDEEEEEEVEYIAPAPRKKTKEKPAASRFAQDAAPVSTDPEWDDLSDLGDLSIYFEDENK